MFANPKTSISGLIAVIGAAIYFGYKIYSGQGLSMQDVIAAASAAGGLGLIAAKDGGH